MDRTKIIGLLILTFYLSVAVWLPFYNLHLKNIGFSGTQIGLVSGVYQASLFFIVPIWGLLSDRKGTYRVLRLALAMTLVLILGMRYLHNFYIVLPYILLLAFFHHPLGTLLDSLAIQQIYTDGRSSYGAMRVWGSLGWALGTTVMGQYLLRHSLDHIFPAASIVFLAALLMMFALRNTPVPFGTGHDLSVRRVVSVFSEKRILLFLLILILYGIAVAPLYVFINLYYYDIGANTQIVGIAFAVQSLSEIPFFFSGRWLARRFGTSNLLLSVMGVAILRMLVYSIVSDPVIAVIVGIAQGVTFSLFWVGVVEYMHGLIPSEWRSTGQSLLWAFHLGAGVTIGNVCIGRLSDLYAMQRVMLMAAGVTALVLGLTALYFKTQKSNIRINPEPGSV